MEQPILQVEHLTKFFSVGPHAEVHAVDDVNFTLRRGRTFGLVGESGCGKSSCARTIIRIYEPSQGKIIFNGQDIAHLKPRQMQPVRRNMQMIFQDPMTSLDPVMTVEEQIAEVIKLHEKDVDPMQKAREMLELVGIPGSRGGEYPHQFSGGMKQRAALIRTLALDPQLLLLDEPFSALDYQTRLMVSADICRLIRQAGKTMIIVTHDLSEAISLADKVYVLSARPATIKAVLPIRLTLPDASPLAARNAPEFPYYFKQLWEELTDETTN